MTILDILKIASNSTSKQDGTIFTSQSEYWSDIMYVNNDLYFQDGQELYVVQTHQIIQMIEDNVQFK